MTISRGVSVSVSVLGGFQQEQNPTRTRVCQTSVMPARKNATSDQGGASASEQRILEVHSVRGARDADGTGSSHS
jgi:hypothetical protein